MRNIIKTVYKFLTCQSFLKMSQKMYNISTVKAVLLSVCNGCGRWQCTTAASRQESLSRRSSSSNAFRGINISRICSACPVFFSADHCMDVFHEIVFLPRMIHVRYVPLLFLCFRVFLCPEISGRLFMRRDFVHTVDPFTNRCIKRS